MGCAWTNTATDRFPAALPIHLIASLSMTIFSPMLSTPHVIFGGLEAKVSASSGSSLSADFSPVFPRAHTATFQLRPLPVHFPRRPAGTQPLCDAIVANEMSGEAQPLNPQRAENGPRYSLIKWPCPLTRMRMDVLDLDVLGMCLRDGTINVK